ncbi:zinc ABC transporter substrate-binding protein [Corynebacterium falsenii]|uniref:metal ABC transporter solute-binding protein, Zn/Mn family n=1 Tax=Corynebacterium falsenii TaxID=108486 RepID=UPI001CCE2F83|nr:zinc ABC transporter substrate-binding protein [Corynebacterium falsenii]UBI06703.1 zinc ABC transporter substrate-binding protein [Corynebacterium falsenii]
MKKALASITGVLLLGAGLSACSDGGSTDTPADGKTIKVVASTAIWGDLAKEAADGHKNVDVVTILSSKDDDPHEYEATARDLATLDSADLVVANGGGYDNWLTDHVKQGTPVVTALPITEGHDHGGHDHGADDHAAHDHGTEGAAADGHDHAADGHDHAADGHEGHDHGVLNPHAWFNMDDVRNFGNHVAEQLHKLDSSIPDKSEEITKQADELEKRIKALKGKNVVLTESIGQDVVLDSGLKDVTPEGFANAVTKESEPSAADIAATKELIDNGKVGILITNEQSQTPASAQLIDAAKAHKVAVVNLNETPDEGQTYFEYANSFVDKLEEATKNGS